MPALNVDCDLNVANKGNRKDTTFSLKIRHELQAYFLCTEEDLDAFYC